MNDDKHEPTVNEQAKERMADEALTSQGVNPADVEPEDRDELGSDITGDRAI